jgi:glycosyltransferase involved in cell wall biosynthesis
MKPPAATALMCVYNENPLFLKKAIESVLTQSLRDFIFLIIDDGSTDTTTSSIVSAYAAADERIHLLRHSNRGLTASLIEGIDRCTSSLVIRHDSDDWSEPDRFAILCDMYTARPECGIVTTNYMISDESGSVEQRKHRIYTEQWILRLLPRHNPFCHGSVALNREAVRAVGSYRPIFKAGQDYDLWLRLTERYPLNVTDRPLYHYRHRTGSISVDKVEQQVYSRTLSQTLACQRRTTGHELYESAVADLTRTPRRRAMRRLAIAISTTNLMHAGASPAAFRAWLKQRAQFPADYALYALGVRLLLLYGVQLIKSRGRRKNNVQQDVHILHS